MTKGIFGKLPAHGDFIQRDLPSSFVNAWDDWLQRAVHGSRELVGERWLEYYLTSPIWRFALSPGVLNGQIWAGILVPSVDSVGRYFPITMAVPLPHGTTPFEIQVAAAPWYKSLSELAVEGLQSGLMVDQVLERFPETPVVHAQGSVAELENGLITSTATGTIVDNYPAMLDSFYREKYSSYSLWWCAGSQHLAPTTLLSPGLPDPTVYCSMLGAPKLHW
ncbi:type VI secretion system-associated protein TagF [Microbulbifer aggregans]|uniref:type VI secretion system-associated protein TagF n=1 Tax=Microbulbifer aggregans TaxID=1769779 RepID=UPI001CFD3814|nr:type VI secretion system-associated protein TagF [Microbulbifer aggregans]